jgi:multisite-specific tRNA:(cytosine-C5)-methyltransferase
LLLNSWCSQNRGNRNRGGGGGGWHSHGDREDYQELEKTNEKFETYYNALGIVPEEEKDEFWNTMKRELPNSFRFTGSRGY